MSHPEKKHRIIFIDLMRAIAVLQMVQGHTIDSLLADQYRNPENIIYGIWYFLRGMTAPIFMFTAGTVFTYLFILVKEPFNKNPRVNKGVKRGLLLIFLGYLLRYPTWKVFDFSEVSDYSWKMFAAVDVLHLIGFSLLALLFLFYLTEKFSLKKYYVLAFSSVLIFAVSPFFFKINWTDFLPPAFAGYFYTGSGSLFPFFPWAGYVIVGGILGDYLARNPLVFKTAKFSRNLALIGMVLIIISMIGDYIINLNGVVEEVNSATPTLILFRMGFVLLLNALVSFISLKAESIPKLLILLGRNTLIIYVVHLVILYGSAWNSGLYEFIGKSFTGWQTVFAALVMIALMTLMVILINMFKLRNKQLVT